MYLYKIGDSNQIEKITEDRTSKEEAIQKLFSSHLYELLQINLVKQYHNISGYGQIDALGLDDDFRPVIIEFKRENKEDVITQALDYAHWLKHNNNSFSQLVIENKNDLFSSEGEEADKTRSDIDFKNFRIIIIAKDFTRRQINAAEIAHPNIELVDYKYFKLKNEEILGLEYMTKEPSVSREEFDIDYYFKGKNRKLFEIYTKIESKLKEKLPDDSFELYTLNKGNIAYRTGRRRFLRIKPQSVKLAVGFYFGDKSETIMSKYKGRLRSHKSGWIYDDIVNSQQIDEPVFDELLLGAFEISS
jgi:hypothetical protein